MVKLEGFVHLLNKIMGPALGLATEAQKVFDIAKGKSVLKTLLDAASNFVDNKTNKKSLVLLKTY